MNKPRTTFVTLAIGWTLASAGGTLAADYDKTKIITWDVTDRRANGTTAEKIGPATGQWRYAQHVFAGDRHNEENHDHKDSLRAPPATDLVSGVFLATAPDGSKFGAPPADSEHLRWSPFVKFNQGENLNVGPLELAASSTHLRAESKVQLSTNRRGETPARSGVFLTESAIRLSGTARIQNPIPKPPGEFHDPELVYASSYGTGEIKLTGSQASALIIDGKTKTVTALKENLGTISAFDVDENTGGTAFSGDPLVLSVLDAVTGDLLAEETLFRESWRVSGPASIAWEILDGLVLMIGGGGTASIDMATASDWVLNPFNGSASLTNGLFSVSGDLALLAWEVTTSGGITRARLPVSALDPAMSFDIQANDLGQPAHDIDLVLSASLNGFGEAAQRVPAPGGMLLLLVGIAAMGIARGLRRRLASNWGRSNFFSAARRDETGRNFHSDPINAPPRPVFSGRSGLRISSRGATMDAFSFQASHQIASAGSPAIQCLLLATALATSAVPAYAVFIPVNPVQKSLINEKCNVEATLNWTFAGDSESFALPVKPPKPPDEPGPWTVNVQSRPAATANSRSLNITIQHKSGKPKCDDSSDGVAHGTNPALIEFSNTITRLPRGAKQAGAKQVNHEDHFDIGRFSAAVSALSVPPAADGTIGQVTLQGKHQREKLAVVPSFHNPFSTPVNVTVTPDYRIRTVKPDGQVVYVIADGKAKNEGRVDGGQGRDLTPLLPHLPNFEESDTELTSWRITASGSPTTETTMAFLGDVDGTFSELNLGAAIDLFVGADEFLIPMLRNDSINHLYVAVDLTQWLSFPTQFAALDTFDFVNGMSEELSGFFVATSPITLGQEGYESTNPATGQFYVAATLDGRAVPVPSCVLLVLLGLAALAWSYRRPERHASL